MLRYKTKEIIYKESLVSIYFFYSNKMSNYAGTNNSNVDVPMSYYNKEQSLPIVVWEFMTTLVFVVVVTVHECILSSKHGDISMIISICMKIW